MKDQAAWLKPHTYTGRYALLAIFVILLLPFFAVGAQTLPKTEEETIAGEKVNLQNALSGNVGILILGFSQKSKEQTQVWGKDVLAEFHGNVSVVIFQMPILEAVPKLVRGVVLHSMKKSIPADVQPHFLPVLHNEKEWKEIAQFSAENDAYLLVIDREQKIVWRDHGPLEPARKAALTEKVRTLSKAGEK